METSRRISESICELCVMYGNGVINSIDLGYGKSVFVSGSGASVYLDERTKSSVWVERMETDDARKVLDDVKSACLKIARREYDLEIEQIKNM